MVRGGLKLIAGLAVLTLVGALGAASAAAKSTGDGRGGVKLQAVGKFDSPTHLAAAPGEPRLLFVVELDGRVKLVQRSRAGGWRKRGTFLDIRNQVRSPADGGAPQQGLLSIAFAPDYRSSRRFYLAFTNNAGGIVVREYRRAGSKADRSSARDVLRISEVPFEDHNGGMLQFGADGFLYISTGDGGNVGDPEENAQSTDSLLGKLLRIDPRPGNAGSYGIPANNPLTGEPGLDEIFSVGLRNPWRFSFDRERPRRIAIADVGQDRREELNYERLRTANGANFGWDAFEGSLRFKPDGSRVPAEHELPIHQYGHRGGRCAITGGYVVRDRSLDSLYGRYLYADFCTGELRSLIPKLRRAKNDRPVGITRPGISTFGEGPRGEIYAASAFTGKVWRLRTAA